MKKDNRIILLVLILLVLILAIFWFARQSKSTKNTLGADRDFAIENVSDIHSIKIISKNESPIKLSKISEDNWRVNDQYKVRTDAIRNLLEVAQLARLRYIPNPNAVPNILDKMSVVGLKVQYFDKDNKLIKSYYVGGTTSDEKGTHFLMEGYEKPYVVDIPTLEGTLRPRFITEEVDWRDRTIFELDPEKIVELSVEYPKVRDASFKILKSGNDYEVLPYYELTPKTNRKKRPQLIRDYLDNYRKLAAEYIENDNPKRDSITALLPFSIIRWREEGKEEASIKLFPIQAPQVNVMDLGMTKTIERYFADCSWGEFMLVQQRLVGKFLRPYDYFFYR